MQMSEARQISRKIATATATEGVQECRSRDQSNGEGLSNHANDEGRNDKPQAIDKPVEGEARATMHGISTADPSHHPRILN